MAYSTMDDIRAFLPEEMLKGLTDDEGLGKVDQVRVDEAIAQADAEIDGHLGARYSLPLSPVPALIKKLSVDMALYNLYSRSVMRTPEVRAERYRNSVCQLEGVAKGLVRLGISETVDVSPSGPAVNKPEDENVFSRNKLKGF